MKINNLVLNTLVVMLAVAGFAYVFPWKNIEWGKLVQMPLQTVAVSGEAKKQVANQIAQFSAGVNVIKDKREEATTEINSKMTDLTESLKKFGIVEADIKTTSLNYYQNQEEYYDNGVRKYRPGQWNVSSQVEIKLREIAKANDLAALLASSGANNVYGPNFMLDDTKEEEKELVVEAMTNARDKAEALAKASGRSLGKVISVSESGANTVYPMMYAKADGMGGGGGPSLEPGSGMVYKNLNVVFELK